MISALIILISCGQEKKKIKKDSFEKVRDVELTESERIGIEQIRRLDSLHAIGLI
jgi:hypothetical protein